MVRTTVTLPDTAGPAQLWVPLVQTAGNYQYACQGPVGSAPAKTEYIFDTRYGAPILRATWRENDGQARWLTVQQNVAVRDRNGRPESFFEPLTAAERKFWTAPTESVPLDGVVLATAAKITAGKDTPRERLRAIYNWVIDHTHRDPDVPGCGRGDIKAMLEEGQFGGKCADINGLMVGLARAAGFPAREVYGIRVAPSKLFPCLGRKGDARLTAEISKAQHCRAEAFLDGEGWLPVDPADVCKVVLEEKLPLDSPEIRQLRQNLFGTWEMNWVGYNSATDIKLPGIGGSHKPDFPFLMYPCALTATGYAPCTDPAKFTYTIEASELTA